MQMTSLETASREERVKVQTLLRTSWNETKRQHSDAGLEPWVLAIEALPDLGDDCLKVNRMFFTVAEAALGLIRSENANDH